MAFTHFKECGQYQVTGQLMCDQESGACQITVYPESQSAEKLDLQNSSELWILRSGVSIQARIRKNKKKSQIVQTLDPTPSLALPNQSQKAVQLLKREKCSHE